MSWLRLSLRLERTVENTNNFKSGRQGLKAREIEAKYPLEKAKRLMQLLRQKNLFYYDEDFPDDEEELFSQKWLSTFCLNIMFPSCFQKTCSHKRFKYKPQSQINIHPCIETT